MTTAPYPPFRTRAWIVEIVWPNQTTDLIMSTEFPGLPFLFRTRRKAREMVRSQWTLGRQARLRRVGVSVSDGGVSK